MSGCGTSQRGGTTGVAGKKERQRRLAREHFERQQARRVHHSRRWRSSGFIAVACLIAIGTGTGAYFLVSSGGKPPASASSTPKASAGATHASPGVSPASAAAEPATHCIYTPSPPAARNVGLPPAKPDSKATYRATIVTNRGKLVIDLLNAKATCTVNSFVYLASKGYFNHTPCQRLTTSTIWVLQCGDPTGTGNGGPGYKFADENLAGAIYTQGTVAMLNAGPGTSGSQFFVVYHPSLALHPDYTPFGTVVKGLGIIQNVAKAGTDNANGPGDGHPREKVVIERVIIKKT
jgi:peptidyl-prolyl cis-trans isomerase B (cyclophilin B)